MTFTASRRLLVAAILCAAIGLLVGPFGRWLVVLPLLLFGPGYLVERLLPGPTAPPWQRPALWLGLSLSCMALLYQWTTVVRLPLTTPLLAVLALLVGVGVVWRVWVADCRLQIADCRLRVADLRLWSVVLILIVVITFYLRFVQIGGLALPPWVDPVHHALMVRVAMETGVAPLSLRPYLVVDNLPYHWGYHVMQAAVTQLSGLALPQAMLWTGQVLNGLHAFTVAALAAYFWRKPFAGVVAALVVGLVSIFPAYYLSWGRYTQLTGLLMLPALMMAWHSWLVTPTRRWAAFTILLLAGLSLVHFRVLVLGLAWMLVSTALWMVGPAMGMAGAALALTIPWLVVLATQRLAPAVENPSQLTGGGDYNALNSALIWAGQNRLLVALALIGAFLGLWRRAQAAVALVGWVGCMVLLANPWLLGVVLPAAGAMLLLGALRQRRWGLAGVGLGLLAVNPALVRWPYLWLITNEVVIISLFLPLALLIGGGVAMVLRPETGDRRPETGNNSSVVGAVGAVGAVDIRLPAFFSQSKIQNPKSKISITQHSVRILLVVAAAGWGAWANQSVVNPATVLATPADAAAIAWVDANTPANARFLINATDWFPNVSRGTDGGYWLLTLTGRWISTPPALYTYGSPTEIQAVQGRSRVVQATTPDQLQPLLDLIRQERITHIYLREQSGPLTKAMFINRPGFSVVYERDGVVVVGVSVLEQPTAER